VVDLIDLERVEHRFSNLFDAMVSHLRLHCADSPTTAVGLLGTLGKNGSVNDDPTGDIEAAVRAVLPHTIAPWNVAAHRGADGTWTVELTHEASNGLAIETTDVDATDAVARVIRLLDTSHELNRISRAPKLEHPDTVAGVRTLVQAFGWSRFEVRAIVGLLGEVGALGADETEWLNSSFGEDRPPPRATAIV
jgi:hypothetical protein